MMAGYTITDLGIGQARGLNDHGVVVGSAFVNGRDSAFYWTPLNGFKEMNLPADSGYASDINNVGATKHADGVYHAFRTDIDDHSTVGKSDFTYGDSASDPASGFSAIDNSFIGLTVGTRDSNPVFYNGQTFGIAVQPTDIAEYNATSDATPIAGFKYVNGAGHDGFTTNGTDFTDLTDLLDTDGNATGVALGISPNGKNVVGYGTVTGDGDNVVPSRWSQAGGGAVVGHYLPGIASDVDDAGNLVGNSDFYLTGHNVAIYRAAGSTGPIDLNTVIPAGTGWNLTEAVGLNVNGQICGSGMLNGKLHAFLLTPDSTGPDASVGTVGTPVAGSSNAITIPVNYHDATGISTPTIDSSDIEVVDPNGNIRSVTYNTAFFSGTTVNAFYSFSPPGGTWDSADNGTYTVYQRDLEVYDTVNNSAPAGALATFRINLPAATKPKASGNVYRDANKNGKKDAGEANLAGITVWLDLDNDKVIDSGEVKTATDGSGDYTLSNLAGTSAARVRVQLPGGATQITPSGGVGYSISFASGATNTGKNFGLYTPASNTKTASISGFTFNDAKRSGKYDSGDTLANGKTVWLDLDDGKIDASEPTATTDSHGNFKFTALAAGTYHVRRSFPSGYVESTPARRITLTTGQASTGVSIGSKTG